MKVKRLRLFGWCRDRGRLAQLGSPLPLASVYPEPGRLSSHPLALGEPVPSGEVPNYAWVGRVNRQATGQPPVSAHQAGPGFLLFLSIWLSVCPPR